MVSIRIPVHEITRVAEVRRLTISMAQAEGLTEQASEEMAIVATEAATNLIKHAQSGEIHISPLAALGMPGVEILAIDRGPGMANLAACMIDGFSTSGTAGNGLGAIGRLSDIVDGFSQPGRGTVLMARKFSARPAGGNRHWTFGVVSAPYPGEIACGDGWGVRTLGNRQCILMADGLGHGILAADAASTAVAAFKRNSADSATAMIENIHLALRSTRGAAVAISCIEDHLVHHAGLGNISAVLLGGARPQFMVSHNGTAGLEARRIQQFDYRLPDEATIVMHSDGLHTGWSIDTYPGLLRRHPSVIAGTLYRDASRGRDDVCVLAGRYIWE